MLCPRCGQSISVIATDKSGERFVGSCGDAFVFKREAIDNGHFLISKVNAVRLCGIEGYKLPKHGYERRLNLGDGYWLKRTMYNGAQKWSLLKA